ncbi:hypothetical protein NT6N_28830 [Oceaniferula spumae]|uniref:Ice-binding protein C-terminal domain-containing protein n=1 Tax=Oceaniferula spumae TaxID=2979115 RepID=A0AAT9FPG2_9BACT
MPGPGGNSTFDNVGTNNDEGNYIVLSGISGSSYNLSAQGAGALSGSPLRAPINGIQIIQVVPEPSTTALLALGSLALISRRRKA